MEHWANTGKVLNKSAVCMMQKNLKLSFDGGISGSKKYK
jgi:hypothetical protein